MTATTWGTEPPTDMTANPSTRSAFIGFRCTPEESQRIRDAAAAMGTTVTDYLIHRTDPARM